MNPSEQIDKFIERWRASLAPPFTPEYVDGFIRRHRAEVESRIAQTLAQRRARGGERPVHALDFLAYDALAASERPLDAQTDKQVMGQLMRHVDAQFAEGHNEHSVLRNFAVEYIDARTESIFLRDAGWDVVPLLLERPALVVIASGHVVAVRDWRGGLTIHEDRRGTLNHLFADLGQAEDRLLKLREVLDIDPDTKERLAKYAFAMWKEARRTSLNLPRPDPTNATRDKKRGQR